MASIMQIPGQFQKISENFSIQRCIHPVMCFNVFYWHYGLNLSLNILFILLLIDFYFYWFYFLNRWSYGLSLIFLVMCVSMLIDVCLCITKLVRYMAQYKYCIIIIKIALEQRQILNGEMSYDCGSVPGPFTDFPSFILHLQCTNRQTRYNATRPTVK